MPRAVFPSDPYSILYRILPAPLTSPEDGRRDTAGGATLPASRWAGGTDGLLPSAPRRPGETYARANVPLGTRRALALTAADAGVPLDVAATLLCEAGLLLERLGRRRLTHAREMLDRAAASSRVTRALSAGHADYLRALSCRSWRRDRAELDVPARVLAAVGDHLDEYLRRGELLESAIRWEIGALLAERSMASWGTEIGLGGLQSRLR